MTRTAKSSRAGDVTVRFSLSTLISTRRNMKDTKKVVHLNIPIVKGEEDDLSALFTKKKRVTIRFDYPLSKAFDFTFENPNGFTVAAIVDHIKATYVKIYADPDKYGIWGHEIESLCIEGLVDMGDYIEVHIGS
jgi:hypothetical protein